MLYERLREKCSTVRGPVKSYRRLLALLGEGNRARRKLGLGEVLQEGAAIHFYKNPGAKGRITGILNEGHIAPAEIAALDIEGTNFWRNNPANAYVQVPGLYPGAIVTPMKKLKGKALQPQMKGEYKTEAGYDATKVAIEPDGYDLKRGDFVILPENPTPQQEADIRRLGLQTASYDTFRQALNDAKLYDAVRTRPDLRDLPQGEGIEELYEMLEDAGVPFRPLADMSKLTGLKRG